MEDKTTCKVCESFHYQFENSKSGAFLTENSEVSDYFELKIFLLSNFLMSKPQAVTAFPPPPDYQNFTDENMPNITPPPIPETPVQIFKENEPLDSTVPPLPENIPRLYNPDKPLLEELKKINHQILFAFQALVGIIATGEENPENTLNQIKYLFVNAHHLLHRLRDVQGYEHMRRFLDDQNHQLNEFKNEFRDKLEEIKLLKPPSVP